MKQKTKYPKAAKAVGGVALFLIVLGFKAPALFVLGGFLGLVAIILALGPDNHGSILIDDSKPIATPSAGFVFQDGITTVEASGRGIAHF